ncbi:TonB-linked outer membrane protein, SusC/RagA family [Flexibacter flexilis DSM 6793]|uniref:TonB-linked outer membrane protein, SusC/RagA family n=1 Tax=Flexibacter flexilis DSM 6793 TaxID=927664 RepID=A0A1I1HDX1_9BACT|nr:SusC/RagA family TonB-linked outer membrane protein [Flexibacter flexilis]SFC19300.1 TonB-linked outer membrane protein, SusC/RagA family [Flexibacter flexilis DSM 6793]
MKKTLLISFVLMVAVLTSVLAQVTKTVTGKVTSALDGSPLPGVNVVVKGTTQGVISDVDGKYSIEVPSVGGTLVFSFVGMNTSEVAVGDNATINLAMETDIAQLSEVVVTALGIEREKRSVGYAVTQVGGSQLTNSRETNMVQALAGKVAGVQVMGGGGTPGASSKIILRGNKSFGDNQPLFVIDGIPMDNSTDASNAGDNPYEPTLEQVNYSNRAVDINPNDIESMTVLKGPAAAALYGVRGGNGVIMITTKKGKFGQKTRVDINSSIDFSQVNKLPDLQTTYGQSDGSPQSWGAKNTQAGVNNAEKFFKTGVTTSNDVAITSGTEKNSYRLSVGHLHQDGIIPTTNFSRFTARLTAQSELRKDLTASTTVSFTNSGGRRAQQGSNASGVMLSLLRAPSSFDLLDAYNHPNADGSQNNYWAGYDNTYWSLHHNPFKDNNKRLIGNISLNYTPMDWLKVTYRLGLDNYTDYRRGIYDIGAHNSAEVANGQITENYKRHLEIYSDLIISANKEFTEKIHGSLSLGNNINQRENSDLYSRGRGFSIDNFFNMNNAASFYSSQYDERIRSAAFFYDGNISYNNMLFIGSTGRQEYSSTFGPNRRHFFFASATGSFVFTELEAIKNSNITNFGKLRLSYARSANTPSAYDWIKYPYKQPSFADGYTNGFSLPYLGTNGYGHSNTIGNPDLKPEFTAGPEVGLEVNFLKDRIKADVTYYNQKTTDIILESPASPSSGYTAKLSNAATIVNKGWEISLSGTPVKTKDFDWTIDVNYTRNRNEVTALAKGVSEQELASGFEDARIFAIVGKPYGSIYGTKWQRDSNGKIIVGANGRPLKTTTLYDLGNPYPDFIMGIRNTFTYKDFKLSALLDIHQGGKMWNGTNARLNRFGVSAASASVDRSQMMVVDGVKEDGSKNDIQITPQEYYTYYKGDLGAVEENVQDISWVRLREVSLGYTIRKIKYVQAVDITFTGRNLWLKSNYVGMDPETSLTGAGSNYNGIDWFGMPNTKSYNIALHITL